MEPKRLANLFFSAQLCSKGQILVFAIQIFVPKGLIPTLRGRKVRKSKVKIFGRNFQLQRAIKTNLPLVERSHTYECVQLVEYYQKILVTYLDHSGNKGGSPLDGVSGGVID